MDFLTVAFLQTWEDPAHISEDCEGHIGDNDPVDIVEIGDRTSSTGSIYAVKPIAGEFLEVVSLNLVKRFRMRFDDL